MASPDPQYLPTDLQSSEHTRPPEVHLNHLLFGLPADTLLYLASMVFTSGGSAG